MSRTRPHAETPVVETPAPARRISLAPAPMVARAQHGASTSPLHKHMAAALALGDGEVQPCRVDPHRAAANFARTCEVLLAHRDALDATTARVDWDAVEDRRDLGDALVLASAQPADLAAPTLATDLRALTPWSSTLASDLRTLTLRGRLSEGDRALIVGSQQNAVSRAASVLSMVKAYRDRAARFEGFTTLGETELRQAESVAEALLPRLRQRRPRNARALAAQRDLRDRVWTLLLRQYEVLTRAAGALWGMDIRAHVPTLRAGVTRRARATVTDTVGTK